MARLFRMTVFVLTGLICSGELLAAAPLTETQARQAVLLFHDINLEAESTIALSQANNTMVLDTIFMFSQVLGELDPSVGTPVIFDSMIVNVERHGLNRGFLAPAITTMDRCLALGQPQVAGMINPLIGRVNPPLADRFAARLGVESQFEFGENAFLQNRRRINAQADSFRTLRGLKMPAEGITGPFGINSGTPDEAANDQRLGKDLHMYASGVGCFRDVTVGVMIGVAGGVVGADKTYGVLDKTFKVAGALGPKGRAAVIAISAGMGGWAGGNKAYLESPDCPPQEKAAAEEAAKKSEQRIADQKAKQEQEQKLKEEQEKKKGAEQTEKQKQETDKDEDKEAEEKEKEKQETTRPMIDAPPPSKPQTEEERKRAEEERRKKELDPLIYPSDWQDYTPAEKLSFEKEMQLKLAPLIYPLDIPVDSGGPTESKEERWKRELAPLIYPLIGYDRVSEN